MQKEQIVAKRQNAEMLNRPFSMQMDSNTLLFGLQHNPVLLSNGNELHQIRKEIEENQSLILHIRFRAHQIWTNQLKNTSHQN